MDRLLIVVVIVLGLLIACLVYDEASADKFYLRKDSWHCIASHTDTQIMPMQSGDITTYNTQVYEVCDDWRRNGR